MAGDLIDLSADGSAGPHGDRAFARVGYDAGLQIGAEFCHGIRLSLAAEANGNASAGAEIARFLEAIVTIEAGAKVRAELVAQISGNLTDTFGLTAMFAAEARAYVRASLSLDVRLGELLDDSRPLPLERRLLDRLLEQMVLRAGIQATAEIAAAAHGTLVCRIQMGGRGRPPAGFDISVSGGAGFLYGTSCDFTLLGRIASLPDYFRDIRTDILDELLGDTPRPLVRAGIKMITDVVIDTMDDDISSVDAMTDSLRALLFDMSWDSAVAGYDIALRKALSDIASELQNATDPAALARFQNLSSSALAATDAEDALRVLSQITEFATEEDLPQAPGLTRMSVHAHALWKMIEPEAAYFDDVMPLHVRTALHDVNVSGDHLGSRADAALLLAGPDVQRDLEGLLRPLPAGDTLIAILKTAADQGISTADLFLMIAPDADADAKKQLAGLAVAVLALLLENEVEPELEIATSQAVTNGDMPPELADAIMEMVVAGRRVILPGLVNAQGPNLKEELQTLAEHAQQILSRIFLRQVALLGASVTNRAARGFAAQMDRMIDRIETGESDLIRRMATLTLQGLSNALPVDLTGRGTEAELTEVLETFAIAAFGAGRRAFGPTTWSEQRLDDVAEGIVALITGAEGETLDYRLKPREELDRELLGLRECSFLPQINRHAADKLIRVQREIGTAQFRLIAQDMPPLVAALVQDVTRIIVSTAIEAALEGVQEVLDSAAARVEAALEDAKKALADNAAKLETAAEEIRAAMEALVAELDAYVTAIIDEIEARLKVDDLDDLIAFLGNLWDQLFGTTDEEKARKALANIKERAKERLKLPNGSGLPPALAALQGEILTIGRTSEVTNFATIRAAILPEDDLEVLRNIPIHTDVANGILGPLDLAKATKDAVRTRIERIQSSEMARESANNRHSRAKELIDVHNNTLDQLERQRDLRGITRAAQGIRFTSAASVDPDQARLPIFGDWVYVEIDMGELDPAHLKTDKRIPFDALIGQDPTNVQLIRQSAILKAQRGDFDTLPNPLVDMRLFLNGKELDASKLRQNGPYLSGYLSSDLLKTGQNELLLTFSTARADSPAIVRHVTFWSAPNSEVPPSDAIQIDRESSVINTQGNDHRDAVRTDPIDRETVVIKNTTEDLSIELQGHTLSDAYGHTYTFTEREKLRAGTSVTVTVGASGPEITHNWLSNTSGPPRAILNNEGECLLLRAPDGMIVSQAFTGNPGANRWVNIIGGRR